MAVPEKTMASSELQENVTAENILEDLELDEVQKMLDEMMGRGRFSLKQMVSDLIEGKEALSVEVFQDI